MTALSAGVLLAACLLAPSPLAGQETPEDGRAFRYLLRQDTASYNVFWGRPPALSDLDLTGEPPLRVVQGPDVTWVVEPGDRLTRANALLLLQDDRPLLPGPGPILLRGWPERVPPGTVSLELERGEEDRRVADREALHYRLSATVERASWRGPDTAAADQEPPRERYRVTGDLWVLPDLPFSWATFGAGPRALPELLPELRERLAPRLDSLGLVGRAVLRVQHTRADTTGGTSHIAERLTAFEVSDIGRAEAPPAPEPVLDRRVLTDLRRLLAEHPVRTCESVARGDLPAVARARVPHALWPPLSDFLHTACLDRGVSGP